MYSFLLLLTYYKFDLESELNLLIFKNIIMSNYNNNKGRLYYIYDSYKITKGRISRITNM